MADYFLDSSAIVKRYVLEAGSDWIKSLVQAQSGHTLYIARITIVEVTAAVTRRQHSAADAGVILGHFHRHLTQRYRVIELTPVLLNNASKIARGRRLRAYDAVQLTVALELQRLHQDAGLGPVTLVSADRELNAAAQVEGLVVEDPSTRE